MADKSHWYVYHAAVGLLPYESESSLGVVDEHLAKLNHTQLKSVSGKQEECLKRVIGWLDQQGISSAYFDGYYEKDEKEQLRKIGIGTSLKKKGKDFHWNSQLIDTILLANIKNLYLCAKDGSALIVYDDWDTIFVRDPDNDFPADLRAPSI